MVEQVFDQITSSLVREETVKLSGFGLFTVHQKKKKERLGRNPKTGEPAPISARRVVSFRPSAVLKDKLNSSKPHLSLRHKSEPTRQSSVMPWLTSRPSAAKYIPECGLWVSREYRNGRTAT